MSNLPSKLLRIFVITAAIVGAFAPLSTSLAATVHAAEADMVTSSDTLDTLVDEALAVRTPTMAAAEYADAADRYDQLLGRLELLATDSESKSQAIDRDLLHRHLRTRLFEISELRLQTLVPVRYFVLHQTSDLFLRPCSGGVAAVEAATKELTALPQILANGRKNLTRPARVWTQNAIYQADYAEQMLAGKLPLDCDYPADVVENLEMAQPAALEAVIGFAAWLENELLPRSERSPAWKPAEIEHYQFVHEGLDDWGVDAMIELAAREETQLLEEMHQLAQRIHPSGDLVTVWRGMKEEAPPWPEIQPMAERYVEQAAHWLHGPGSHLVTIPDFDYGVAITPPMARRILSFGGASYGPTVAGRLSGYYVLTPVEDRAQGEERLQRLRSYNPYWTHVISYHEWLGHTVQRAHALLSGTLTPMRQAYRGIYLSQAWSFYLEKLLEDEGYFSTMPYMEELKTRMARRQMRMWRVQRILTKLKMAKGEMTFDEAVQAYIDKIGMEPANAFIEVQRDSQSPSPPGREIVGEKVILEMRQEYQRRAGAHYSPRHFHDRLLRWGDLPLPTIRQLMFDP